VTSLAACNGPLTFSPQRIRLNLVTGNLEICAVTGRTIARVTDTRLCRCGYSQNKPYCDGGYARVGFRSEP
jgi:CDGSH-type Zn-finger protein